MRVQEYEFKTTKTYATPANARAAVAKAIKDDGAGEALRFFIHRDEATGRFFPVFIGAKCLQYGVHFKFHVVG